MRKFPWILALIVAVACCETRAEGLTDAQRDALRGIARGEAPAWSAVDAAQSRALEQRAGAFLAHYQQHFLPFGLSADVLWTDRARSEVAVYEGIGDSACHTGQYLAALALHHAAAPSPKLLQDMHAVLDRFEVLSRISGSEGYITRFAGPIDSRPYHAYYHVYGKGEDPARPGFGKRAFQGVAPWEDQAWLGWSSRDTYAGVQFGLAAAWHYVPDEALHKKIETIVERVGKRLIADGWDILDPKGFKTPSILMMKVTWLRLMLSVCPEAFGDRAAMYRELSGNFAKQPLDWRGIDAKEYYPNNLKFIRLFTLCTLETDPVLKGQYQELVRRGWNGELKTHLNAHFAALYLLLTGDRDDSALATVQGQLLDFPQDKWTRTIDHRGRADVAMAGADYAKQAFLASEWAPTDFLWQRAPALAHGGSDAPLEFPAIDYFLPYWAARVAGVVPAA
ncbi:MAG: hypothetical protein HYV27_17475 [Candidatus Hydrogenedentes bacterium]|nr:hypothetical protein [Candidatus Hydrogenedentota bacterium]